MLKIEITTPHETWTAPANTLRAEIIEMGAYSAQQAEYWELNADGTRRRRLELEASTDRDDQFRYYWARLRDVETRTPVGEAMQWDVRWLL